MWASFIPEFWCPDGSWARPWRRPRPEEWPFPHPILGARSGANSSSQPRRRAPSPRSKPRDVTMRTDRWCVGVAIPSRIRLAVPTRIQYPVPRQRPPLFEPGEGPAELAARTNTHVRSVALRENAQEIARRRASTPRCRNRLGTGGTELLKRHGDGAVAGLACASAAGERGILAIPNNDRAAHQLGPLRLTPR